MYVAKREFKALRDGKPFLYHPGDVIPDFEKWDYNAQKANLNMEWVEQVIEAPPTKMMAPKKKALKPKAKKAEKKTKALPKG